MCSAVRYHLILSSDFEIYTRQLGAIRGIEIKIKQNKSRKWLYIWNKYMSMIVLNIYSRNDENFLHARPWIPGDEKSIFTVVIH